MAKLLLMYDQRILREITVGPNPVGIGRLPDNTVVIDNPAVSGHHARVVVEGDRYILEDLQSMNGTFVNEKRITRQSLNDGDVVLVGKHKLVFQSVGRVEPAPTETKPTTGPLPSSSGLGRTVFLDTKANRELLAKLAAQAEAQRAGAAATPTAPLPTSAAPGAAKTGVLTVISGSTDKPEYVLEAQTAIIGKSAAAQIRLRGWFKPAAAAAISRKEDSYVVTPLEAKIQVNSQTLAGPYELKDGDLLLIKGVCLKFSLL